VTPKAQDIDSRLPVWDALSSLFLDTDTSLLRDWRAKTLAASPYSLNELDTILSDEVTPVCMWNLASVAGEWAGFDPEWLKERILRQPARPRWWSFISRRSALNDKEWRRTRELVESLRAAASV
jgi:hypothetical protein